jgi:hypothetical protein
MTTRRMLIFSRKNRGAATSIGYPGSMSRVRRSGEVSTMACICNHCGAEYEDVNALVENRDAGMRALAAAGRAERLRAERQAMEWAWGGGDTVFTDSPPSVGREADPGLSFLGLFKRGVSR